MQLEYQKLKTGFKNIIISIVAGIALGLTRSNYLKLFCIIFLAFFVFLLVLNILIRALNIEKTEDTGNSILTNILLA